MTWWSTKHYERRHLVRSIGDESRKPVVSLRTWSLFSRESRRRTAMAMVFFHGQISSRNLFLSFRFSKHSHFPHSHSVWLIRLAYLRRVIHARKITTGGGETEKEEKNNIGFLSPLLLPLLLLTTTTQMRHSFSLPCLWLSLPLLE